MRVIVKVNGSDWTFDEKDMPEIINSLIVAYSHMQGEIDLLKAMLHRHGLINEAELDNACKEFMSKEEVRGEYVKRILGVR